MIILNCIPARAVEVRSGYEAFYEVTAYCTKGSVTASGTMPKAGRTVAGPRYLKLGTCIFIEGRGIFILEDRMNARFPERFDLYMESREACLKFGKQKLKIKIL